MVGVTQAGARLELGERKQPNQRGLEQEGDNIPSEVRQQRDSEKATQPLSEPHPEGRDERQPALVESSSGKKEAALPVEEPQLKARREHQEQDTYRQRRLAPRQRARGDPAFMQNPSTQSEGLRPEGGKSAKKEAIPSEILSPESPGED